MLGGKGFELDKLRGLAHGNQEVTGIDQVRGAGIETNVTVYAAYSQDHHSIIVVDAGIAYGFSCQRRLLRYLDLFNHHLQFAGAIGSDVEEIQDVGTKKALGNPVACGCIGRDDHIGAGSLEMPLGAIFTGAGNNFEAGIQALGGEHDIDVGCVGSGGRHQTTGAVDTGFAQGFLAGSIAHQHKPFGVEFRQASLVAFDDDKWTRFSRQLARHAVTYASGAADDVMVFQVSDFAFHPASSEDLAQFEF